MSISAVFSQYTISGVVKVQNQNMTITKATVAPCSFRIIFKGHGTDLTDSVTTNVAYDTKLGGYTFSRNFTKGWWGKVYIHKITDGFKLDTTIFYDSLAIQLPSGVKTSIVNNFNVLDTMRPAISGISVTPAIVKEGNLITLAYSAVDNRRGNESWCLKVYNGSWVIIDSFIDSCLISNSWNGHNTIKFALNQSGDVKIKISVWDFSGNQADSIITIKIQPNVFILNLKQHSIPLMQKNNVPTFNLSGRKISRTPMGCNISTNGVKVIKF
jgi:hypothetical protein